MSTKEMELDGSDVVPSEDHDLRISMENLKGGTYHRKSSSFFEMAEQSVGRWTIKPSKRCFETVGSMCTSS